MNSLNLLSSRVIGPSPAPRPRSRSQGELLKKDGREEYTRGRSYSDEKVPLLSKDSSDLDIDADAPTPENTPSTQDADSDVPVKDESDEKTPLLDIATKLEPVANPFSWRGFVKRLADALTAIFASIGAPVVWLAGYFKNDEGQYRLLPKRQRRRPSTRTGSATGATSKAVREAKLHHSYSSESLTSTATESDGEVPKRRLSHVGGEPRRSSIRIKEQNDSALKKRKQKRNSPLGEGSPMTVDKIKSPTSPVPSLKVTRYPHAPQPPRPLVPRRQPSYSNLMPRSPGRHGPVKPVQEQKTLVLDLDETLIHSLAKGGRMSSGHMVEVKLNAPVAVSSQANQPAQVIGPQHPILYYVHKRPHCDEFLKKVCKWYKLVVFTASVQEYADPVIDWLEQERKYFVGRYYRQHCTFRNGAYIKDLSSIEPDLSKVVILDNSPLSYVFHEGTLLAEVLCVLTLTVPDRQRDSHRGMDQRSHRQRSAPSDPHARGSAVCHRCSRLAGSATRRGRSSIVSDQSRIKQSSNLSIHAFIYRPML
jgi:CTD nuclear envelope phosphatase 1